MGLGDKNGADCTVQKGTSPRSERKVDDVFVGFQDASREMI